MPQPSQIYERKPNNMERLPAETREVVMDAYAAAGKVMLDALGWQPSFSGTVTLEFNNGCCAKVRPAFTL